MTCSFDLMSPLTMSYRTKNIFALCSMYNTHIGPSKHYSTLPFLMLFPAALIFYSKWYFERSPTRAEKPVKMSCFPADGKSISELDVLSLNLSTLEFTYTQHSTIFHGNFFVTVKMFHVRFFFLRFDCHKKIEDKR